MHPYTIILLLLLGTLSTASSAIGLQCLNKNPTDAKSSNHGYLSFILGVSIVAILTAIGGIAFNVSK
jgi:multisubunit Na+/H+ antiporter MnhG subunit